MVWIRLFTWLRGEFVGQDDFGSWYYREKGPGSASIRRWVLYKGTAKASEIPPEWDSWLQYTRSSPPSSQTLKRWSWEKKHLPNLTGTPYAYKPKKAKTLATQGYKAWRPSKEIHENKFA